MSKNKARVTALPTNVTGISQSIIDAHHPLSQGDVVQLVMQARREGRPLYPLSRGYNWGYGSASPATAGCSLVDLGGMKRILNADKISALNPVAVIEPGVTQGQLYEFLQRHCPELTFNVTGAGKDTSIIGNALDRGVGYLGPRKDDLFGLEVVCGSGEVLKTGFRRLGEDSPLAHSHPFGLGPILDGVFFQGNFGIVTSACFRLFSKRPKEVAVSLALRVDASLGDFVNELSLLKRDGLMVSVTHIANKARSQSSLMYGMSQYFEQVCKFDSTQAVTEAQRALQIVAPNEWTSLGAVTGNPGQVRAALREIRARMQPFARVMVVSEGLLDVGYAVTNALRFIPYARANAAAIAAIRPLHGLALGIPTDVAIDNLLWKYGRSDLPAAQLDDSNCGLLFISPALPPDGKLVERVVSGMIDVAARHGHTLYVTVNIETATSLVAIINLLFDRSSPTEVQEAHRCADALLVYVHAQGLEIYRARADMMKGVVDRAPEYWRVIRSLKQVFDPDNIIAPGRYNLAQ